MDTVLAFLTNDANENEGLGDAGIATFQDRPYASAAKEAGQNSRDAMLEKPVRMVFKLHRIPKDQIPGIDQLIETVACCIERVTDHYNEKEEDFFLKAQDVLEKESINVLEISDFNTKGLVGPAINGKPFYALLKGSGVSDKGDESDGASSGSFGIGKNASFAISELRTVFYSTIYADEQTGQEQFIAQGKVKLVSHTDKTGKPRKAAGWWGLPGFHEVSDAALVPEWMRRVEKGTSVFSVGFRVEDNWEYRVVAALVRTFFIAINSGEMEFFVGDDIKIARENLEALFDDSRVCEAVDSMHLTEDFDFARALYRCERFADSDIRQIVSSNSQQDGNFEVKILKAAGLPKRVGFVRNGMLITDNLKTFGHSFMRFPMCADFIALVQPANKETGALLKRLENPAHDQFSAERIADDRKRENARRVLEKTGKQIRDLINSITKSVPKNVEAVDELAEFFADPLNLEEDQEGQDSVNRYNYKSVPPSKRSIPNTGKGDGQKGGGTRAGNLEGGGRRNSGHGLGNRRGKTGPGKIIPINGVRNSGSKRTRTIWFTPTESDQGVLRVSATGLSDSAPLAILSSSQGKLSNGKLELEFVENQRVMIDIELAVEYTGPIEVDAYREDDNEDQ